MYIIILYYDFIIFKICNEQFFLATIIVSNSKFRIAKYLLKKFHNKSNYSKFYILDSKVPFSKNNYSNFQFLCGKDTLLKKHTNKESISISKTSIHILYNKKKIVISFIKYTVMNTNDFHKKLINSVNQAVTLSSPER